jgi:hypothetical protein
MEILFNDNFFSADEDAHYARMSHVVSERLKDMAKTAAEKINLIRVSKIALTFCVLVSEVYS